MVDQNKNDLAYALIDVDGKVGDDTLKAIEKIDGVIKVRPIYK